jgi:NAD(P)-dependent dehydrogenase (short-subunit alcohol dehydrogenase family)
VSGICAGRVVIVTGAGRGLGRAHALEFARQGARVVVNDLGAELDGTGSSTGPAGEVVDEIRGLGGEAVANGDDVADWDGASGLVRTALDTWGRLDALVNNAGFLRDRMVVSTSEEEWDAVIRVHLKGHFCPTRHATGYWREQSKAGDPRAHAGGGGRARPLRRDRERDRARGPHAHDGGRVRRHDGPARGGLRRDGAREREPARGVARQRRVA